MKYLLDTNTCIAYINGRSVNVLKRLQTEPVQNIAVCSVVKAELYYGASKSNQSARSLARQQAFVGQFVSLPFDDKAANLYGPLRAQLESVGTPIGPYDYLIACIALTNGLTLVTHNTREFSRVSGLAIEDWEQTA